MLYGPRADKQCEQRAPYDVAGAAHAGRRYDIDCSIRNGAIWLKALVGEGWGGKGEEWQRRNELGQI
jgi:hypothetical protein